MSLWDDIRDDEERDFERNITEYENDSNKKPENDMDSNITRGLASPLASEESTKISLQFIRERRKGLNKHRQLLLNRVPEQEKWAVFSLNSIEDKDLAYLSAATGDEFALLRGKKEDILFYGTVAHCHLEKDELLMSLLREHKISLECHSHPDFEMIIPSQDDRNFIASFGQKSSRIISSYTGKVITFNANRFEDLL